MTNNSASMAGKIVLITGSTNGIGRATAEGLARLGAQIAITGRDQVRADQVAGEIAAVTGNPSIHAYGADLSSQTQVRRLASQIAAAHPRLDVLVNNVGGFWATRRITPDGLEHTFALNHLAPFLLTRLLLDRLKASAPARIVTVSSGAQAMGRIDFDDLQGEHRYSGQKAYNQSKLANVMFTYELARRLDGTGITATVVHPGVVRTGFAAEDASLLWRVMIPLARPFMRTPAKGADTTIYLASSPDAEGVTGRYFANRKPKTTNKTSYDRTVAARLWDVSEQLTADADNGHHSH